MPANKNAITRFRILDRCFRNHFRQYYIKDLMEECEKELGTSISRKTIYNDIDYMESAYDIELERIPDGKRVFYRYKDPNCSINNSPLSSAEIAQLHSAIDTLSQFKGLPQFDWMEDIIDKLKLSSGAQATDVIGFDANIDLKGRNYVGELYQYIINRVVLKVEYFSFKWDKSMIITFHPHYMRQYNNRWFVFGYNSDIGIEGWNMALDRICSISPTNDVNYKESDICWREYFDDIIGVTNKSDAPVEEIVLHCYGSTGKYIETKPIHASQRSKWIETDCLQVSLKVKQNYELESFILSQGGSIKVISPLSLKSKIMNVVEAMENIYNG